MNDQPLQLDINLLLKELGLESLEGAEKQQIADLLERNIKAKLELYLNDQMTPEESEKFADKPTEEIIKYFEEDKGINFEVLTMTIAMQCREELLQDVAYIKGLMDAKKGE